MIIFIPTKKRNNLQYTARALVDAQITKKYLCFFVIDEYEQPPDIPGFEHVVSDDSGIGSVRNFIVNFSPDDKICMVDDDLRFYKRPDISDCSLFMASNEEVFNMIEWIDNALNGYAHASISARTQNFQCTTRLEQAGSFELETVRPYRFYAIDKSIVLGEELDFNAGLEINTMDDFHMTLELLELGYPNLVNFKMAHEQVTSNSCGGCSTYRDLALLEICAENLHSKHPQFVKLHRKQTINSWEERRVG